MTYASGGLIQATDFNGFAGGSAGANVSGQINTVWATGQGNAGYGQTAVANVSAGSTVTAAQWASLINAVNAARDHQTNGAFSNITVPTAGTTISFLSTLSGALTDSYTNRLTRGVGLTGVSTLNKSLTLNAGAGTGIGANIDWTVTFASVDAARYFFNAGGELHIVYASFTNTAGTSRGSTIQTLAQTNFQSKAMRAITFGARTGTGGTVNVDTTTLGYYGQSTSLTMRCSINATTYYSGSFVEYYASTTGGAGSYGGNGNAIQLRFNATSPASGSTQPADTINVTLTMQCQIQYPVQTYIANSWGTPTIS